MKAKNIVVLVMITYLFITPAVAGSDYDQFSIHGIKFNTSLEEAERLIGIKSSPYFHEDLKELYYDYERTKEIDYKDANFIFFDKKIVQMQIYRDLSPLSREEIYSKMLQKYGRADYSKIVKGYYDDPDERHMCWGNCRSISATGFQSYMSCHPDIDSGKCFSIKIRRSKFFIIAVNGYVNSNFQNYMEQRQRERQNKKKERQKKKFDF